MLKPYWLPAGQGFAIVEHGVLAALAFGLIGSTAASALIPINQTSANLGAGTLLRREEEAR